MAHLAGISIYPVKSLEPLVLEHIRVLRSGALEGDRKFALHDQAGKFINGKRNSLVHRMRSGYDPFARVLRLTREDGSGAAEFHVDRQLMELEAWLSEFFQQPIFFKINAQVGFPDDLDCPGPTVISTATLEEVASWFPGLDANQIRLRIRANLEIGGVPAFWEDRLYGVKDSLMRFSVGECVFDGNNPCQRCAVPPRDPITGEGYPDFAKIFMERREQTLPSWAERSRFNHFYRLAVNTLVAPEQVGKILKVGDAIEVVDTAPDGT